MVQKFNGNKKKKKVVKCDKCSGKFDLEDEEIVKMAGIKYVECIYCGQEIILK